MLTLVLLNAVMNNPTELNPTQSPMQSKLIRKSRNLEGFILTVRNLIESSACLEILNHKREQELLAVLDSLEGELSDLNARVLRNVERHKE